MQSTQKRNKKYGFSFECRSRIPSARAAVAAELLVFRLYATEVGPSVQLQTRNGPLAVRSPFEVVLEKDVAKQRA